MGNCYIFNPANGVVQVTLNNFDLGPIAPAFPSGGYAPQSIFTPMARHIDEQGSFATGDPNLLSIFYPDDPEQQFGPYAVQICVPRNIVSVDDDIVIFAGRPLSSGAPSVVTMTKRGFVLNTLCRPSADLFPTGDETGAT